MNEMKSPSLMESQDGIQLHNNPAPAWWTWIFLLTMTFCGVYALTILLSMGEFSAEASYRSDQIAEVQKSLGDKPLPTDAAGLVNLAKNIDMKAIGAGIFATNCASCHGREGAGVTGPNLTDDYYLNVKKIEDFVDVIKNGRNNAAMPAWGNRLQPNEIAVVAAYAASLRGGNKPSMRPHEGQAIPQWSEK